MKLKDEEIPVPHPQIHKRFKYLTDISNWVTTVNKLNLYERKLYFDNILQNELYLTSDQIYQVKNMYLPNIE